MSVLGDLRVVAVHRDFRKLFTVRLVSQCGDGMFQVGLATLFFFSPERMATAAAVAAAFAVLLLPFTVVGPFAGPLLDRWRRRQVLLVGNAVRVVLGLTLAWLMVSVGVGPAVYVLALVTLGINRFLLAALSAALPRVVPREQLLMANTLTPTLGAVSAVVGGALGFVIGLVVPAGPAEEGAVLVSAALLFGAASALALRLGRDRLGPQRVTAANDASPGPTPGARPGGRPSASRGTATPRDAATSRGTTTPGGTAASRGTAAQAALTQVWQDVRATAGDLADGARYLIARRTPATALGVMAVHRFLYGANFIALILMSRNLLSDPLDAAAGMATFGLLLGISFVGNGLAIVATPLAHERMRPATWVALCLVIGALSQGLLTVAATFPLVATAAVLLGLSVQGAKIAVDTIVQADTEDDVRGRAFSLYDVLYNAAFVGAAALAAVVLPDVGWSRAVFATLVLVYLALALAYRRESLHHPRPTPITT